MPMQSADGRFLIVYNGEVYNTAELRERLLARGYSFRSRTDTEVVLHLYVDEGPAMLDRLNGMFAIAIWDTRDRALFLARDRLGVKPLYYALERGTLRFASEQKALFAAGVHPDLDPSTWEELLCFRFVAGEQTPFAGVRRLLPGHFLLWQDGRILVRRWWHLADRARRRQETLPPSATEWFRETFDDAVRVRRISDVPVGVLLSGGLDSGSVAASLARQSGSGVDGFTVAFDQDGYDEGPLAKQVADRWHLTHHQVRIPPSELLSRLLEASWLNDEPLVHGNELHLRAVSACAKPFVTVLLSGEGGDETLGGYIRYAPLRHPSVLAVARALVPSAALRLSVNGRLRKLGRLLELDSRDAFVLFNSCTVFPADLTSIGMRPSGRFPYREAALAEAKTLYPSEPFRQAMYMDQHTFLCSLLDRNDRMTMGASIECRVPFLDYRLVEGMAALPTSTLAAPRHTKTLLRRAVGDRLPTQVLRTPKWGFGVPWEQYMLNAPGIRDAVASLPESAPISDGPFERRTLRRMVRAFLAGDLRGYHVIRQLLMIQLWYQACVAEKR